jgi:hypothetical protein
MHCYVVDLDRRSASWMYGVNIESLIDMHSFMNQLRFSRCLTAD